MIWPERPQCHDGDRLASRFGPAIWRAPHRDLMYGRLETFQTCSYCGSIHPASLYEHLSTTTHPHPLDGADWKYGWPHKFYVDGIANPMAGQPCQIGSSNYPRLRCADCSKEWVSKDLPRGVDLSQCPDCGSLHSLVIAHITEPIMGTASPFLHAKFYAEHLRDLQVEAFDALTGLIDRFTAIKFVLTGGQLQYYARKGTPNV